jgi:hypothetical protein
VNGGYTAPYQGYYSAYPDYRPQQQHQTQQQQQQHQHQQQQQPYQLQQIQQQQQRQPTTALPAAGSWIFSEMGYGEAGSNVSPPLLKIKVHQGQQSHAEGERMGVQMPPIRQGGSKGRAKLGAEGWAIELDVGGKGKGKAVDIPRDMVEEPQTTVALPGVSVAMSGDGSSENSMEKKPIIACHNCRAKKLK